jgi:hypothetical protein
MKVEKAVGWVAGLNGTGVVYEVSDNGKYILATIEADGTFRPISLTDVISHALAGKGQLLNPRPEYLAVNNYNVLPVENPQGWTRIFTPATTTDPAPVETEEPDETDEEEEISIPFSIQVNGTIKFSLGSLSSFFKLVD